MLGGRGKRRNIKRYWVRGIGYRVSGLTPVPDAQYPAPATRSTLAPPARGDRLRFERSFEILRPYDERLDHLLTPAARVSADRGYPPPTITDLSAASCMSL